MLISKNWLTEYVDIPKKLTADELAERITIASVEVEEVRDLAKNLEGIVVAEILEVQKHPNADKLQLAKVSDGKKTLDIVCGAPNIARGQKVPLATVGTFLPALGFAIEEREVRGEKSQGMLCAPDEIGLGEDHAGILILDDSLKAGMPLAKALGLDDWILEIDNKSMTHRPDMWGHYGMARELAAIFKTPFKEYKAPKITPAGKEELKVEVKDFAACPRYMGVIIDGIKIEESPDWLKNRLLSIGQKPINNIVDITNYVMFEMGQAMHAFDFDAVADARIIVRKAKTEELVTTLDDKELELTKDDLVIADTKRVLAIAGIKGAKDAGVTEKTTKIILESANFDHITVRKTSQRLSLRTDASARYEKSLDPNLTEICMARAVELIQKVIPSAKVTSKVADQKKFKLNQGPIKTDVQYFKDRIGIDISKKEITDIFKRLGFLVAGQGNQLHVTVPSWRATKDVSIPQDLVEEVARIYGYNNVKPALPRTQIVRPEVDFERALKRKAQDIFAYGFDMSEVYTYSFNSEKDVRNLGEDPEAYIRVQNPQAQGMDLMRKSLLVNLLNETTLNARFYDHFNLFEVGRVFLSDQKGEPAGGSGKKNLPAQPIKAAGIVHDKGAEVPFYTAKNIVEQLLRRLHFTYELKRAGQVPAYFDAQRTLSVLVDGTRVGLIGELAKASRKKLKIQERVGMFEMNLTELAAHYSDEIEFRPIPKYPAIDLDISLIVDRAVLWQTLYELTEGTNKDLIESVSLFDIYEGENIPEGKKSVAFRITYRSDDRTLETKEAEEIHNEVKKRLVKEVRAEIRE